MRLLSFIIVYFCVLTVNAQIMKNYTGLTDKEINIIQNANNSTPFRVLLTTSSEDIITLKNSSIDIDPKDPLIKKLAERMYATVQDENSKGVGIAAPQIGINRNVIWVQRFDKKNEPFEFFINPKITWRSNILRLGKEGCLSIPDQFGNVYRSLVLQISYYDLNGSYKQEIIEGFTAVIFQHEIDHLEGILYLDRIKEQGNLEYQKAEDVNSVYYQIK